MKKFYIFIGTTAEFIKIAPVIKEFKKKKVSFKLIATGQNNIVFADMQNYIGIVKPDILFEDKNKQSSLIGFFLWTIRTFFSCLISLRKEFSGANMENTFLIVHGDTVSSVLGALIGRIYHLNVVHVESGLRSYNFLEPFPEEICRYITSRLSVVHFCPNSWSAKNIVNLGGTIVNTKQNTLYDSYRSSINDKKKPEIFKKLTKKYFILVVHRQEHVFFAKEKTKKILEAILRHVDESIQPIMINLSLTERFLQNTDPKLLHTIKRKSLLLPRLPYNQFMKLIAKSEFMITDGGSNQEESYYMGKPCLLLRNVTERIEGLESNVVLSNGEEKTIADFLKNYKKYKRPPLTLKLNPSRTIVNYLTSKL